MPTEKGSINTTNIESEQAFSLINEFLTNVEKDAINIKNHEYVAIRQLVSKIEKEYKKNKRFTEFMKPMLSPVQKDKYITMLEED